MKEKTTHGLYTPELEHDACGIGFVANINGQFSADFTPVPEPASVAMFAIGLIAVAACARKGKLRRGDKA